MTAKIKLDIDGEETELTVEKARELWEDLNSIFLAPVNIPFQNPVVVPLTATPYEFTITSGSEWVDGN